MSTLSNTQSNGMLDVEYDPTADAAYVHLLYGRCVLTKELDDNRAMDYDASGNLLGIELLGVSAGVSVKGLPREEEVAKALKAAGVSVCQEKGE